MIGNYSYENNIEFEIDFVGDTNIDEFDIIFGEFYDLQKLSLINLEYPETIKSFYDKNGIDISNNLFPLDLDTFILLTKDDNTIYSFSDLSYLYDPKQYSFGMSFLSREDFIKLFNYHMGKKNFNFDDISLESNLSLYQKSFKNMNKNILYSNYSDIYRSFEDSENIFTLFSDGTLLYKNLNFTNFQLFPKSKYIWSDNEGKFLNNNNTDPTSFFGFSAYLNNTNNFGLICYLLNEEIRNNTFLNFNLGISPISLYEVVSINKNISEKYKKILENKNKFIIDLDIDYNSEMYQKLIDIIFNNKDYKEIYENKAYLNLN